VAIALTGTLGVLFALARDFEQLADMFVIAVVPFYLLAVASVFRLRKQADYDPSFRVPLYPFTPWVFILATLFLLGNSLVSESSRNGTLVVFGVILLGIPVYHLTVGRRQRSGM
jgi:L-asparagine transporter-like permease